MCFSYVDINDPSNIRKAALNKDYFFVCTCQKCQLPLEKSFDRFLSGFRCPTVSCTEALVPSITDENILSCGGCGATLPKIERIELSEKAKKIHNEGVDQLEKQGNLKEAHKTMNEAMKIREKILHKYNRELQDSRVKMINILTMMSKEEESIAYLEQSIDFLQTSGHPFQSTISLNWYMIANLTVQMANRKGIKQHLQVYKAFKKAHKGYSITHGPSHPFVVSLDIKMKEFENLCKKIS